MTASLAVLSPFTFHRYIFKSKKIIFIDIRNILIQQPIILMTFSDLVCDSILSYKISYMGIEKYKY